MSRRRRMLMVYPPFSPNLLLNMEYMTPFYPDKEAVMPPLGLLLFAGRVRERWDLRFIDENLVSLTETDVEWADVVAVTGMHTHRAGIDRVLDMANAQDKITVLGGPSVSICPEFYPRADLLHVGEMGDATEELLAYLESHEEKPSEQIVFTTVEKTSLDEQPMPAYDMVKVRAYIVMPTQFSVGCPYNCEFCDIPMIYGRKARLKSPERVVAELQAIYDTGFIGTILLVDDNLIAQKAAARKMLPAVIEWQKANDYPYQLTAEATVNMAEDEVFLELLQQARLSHMFLGIESPDEETLLSISKKQNTRSPLIESIRKIQNHGMEVIMGMILGFDTDSENSGRRTIAFAKESNAPIVYFNLLAALPKTPLWDRMEREGRLLSSDEGDRLQSEELLTALSTNVDYKLPNETVVGMLLETVAEVYSPESVFGRLRWNAENVYGRQLPGVPPVRNWSERGYLIRYTLFTLVQVFWRMGIRADYRRRFWSWVWLLTRLRMRGRINSFLEILLRVSPNGHHLIQWGRTLLADHAAMTARRAASAAQPPTRPLRVGAAEDMRAAS